jgi:hypothetical protein
MTYKTNLQSFIKRRVSWRLDFYLFFFSRFVRKFNQQKLNFVCTRIRRISWLSSYVVVCMPPRELINYKTKKQSLKYFKKKIENSPCGHVSSTAEILRKSNKVVLNWIFVFKFIPLKCLEVSLIFFLTLRFFSSKDKFAAVWWCLMKSWRLMSWWNDGSWLPEKPYVDMKSNQKVLIDWFLKRSIHPRDERWDWIHSKLNKSSNDIDDPISSCYMSLCLDTNSIYDMKTL